MIEIVLVFARPCGWVVWYVRFTVRTFATVCRCLWQAALAVGNHRSPSCGAWWPAACPDVVRSAVRVLERRRAARTTDRNLARPRQPWPLEPAPPFVVH